MVWICDVEVLHVKLKCKMNLLVVELIPDGLVRVGANSIVVL